MPRRAVVPALLSLAITLAAAPGTAAPIYSVQADRETMPVQGAAPGVPVAVSARADADDPAFWVHPTDPARSVVFAAAKDGGLRAYDLGANLLYGVTTDASVGGVRSRFNNVDVQYNYNLNGVRTDLAVATDRGLDQLKIWRIDPAAGTLADIGRPAPQSLFGTDRALADQATGYGLALYRDAPADKLYALVTQRREPVIAQYELVANPDSTVSPVKVRDWTFPDVHDGQSLRASDDADPRRDYGPQFEGLVVDQRTGTLYAAQESVGIWRVNLRTGTAESAPAIETRGSGDPAVGPFFEGASLISRDVEGLAIYYTPAGGYLIASSQGKAHGDGATFTDPAGLDDTFAVFSLDTLSPLGSFRVLPSALIDGVQESDGADVIGLGLPGYPFGLFVTQDGYNGVNPDGTEDLVGTDRNNNFKFVPWQGIAGAFPDGLAITPSAFDPRTLVAASPVPEPASLVLVGMGVIGLAFARRPARRAPV